MNISVDSALSLPKEGVYMPQEDLLARLIAKIGKVSDEDAESITALAKKYGVDIEKEAPEPDPQHEAQESQETEDAEHQEGQELGEATGEVNENAGEEAGEPEKEDQTQEGTQAVENPVIPTVPQEQPIAQPQPQVNVEQIVAQVEDRLTARMNERLDEFAKIIAKGVVIQKELTPEEMQEGAIGGKGSYSPEAVSTESAWEIARKKYEQKR